MRAWVLMAALAAWAGAASAAPPASLEDLLEQVRHERRAEHRHQAEREQRFLAQRDQRQAMLESVLSEKKAAEARAEALRASYQRQEQELTALAADLEQEAGDLTELFAVFRQAAHDAQSMLRGSLVSAQLPQRLDRLAELAEGRGTAGIEDLEALWLLLLEEMTEAGRVRSFAAPVITAAGEEASRQVLRVGAFNAFSDGSYLKYLPERAALVELGRQPPARLRALAADLEQATEGVRPLAVDPSRGAVLGLLVQSPDPVERVRQGGWVGYLILALGAVGLLIVLERYVSLGLTHYRMRRQLRDPERPRPDNPLGRLLGAALERQFPTLDALAARLDEAVSEDSARLHRGLPSLAILAAVAPLMGLLGTVTGMIETFQSITLFGTGDPKLMSGGISQALVTTQLGLAVAIPIVLLHSFLSGRANRLIEILDQESTALVARFGGEG